MLAILLLAALPSILRLDHDAGGEDDAVELAETLELALVARRRALILRIEAEWRS